MKQAVQDYYDAYLACGVLPSDCDPASFTAVDSPMRATVQATVDALRQHGNRFAPDSRGSFIDVKRVVVWGDVAAVDACHFDAGMILGPKGPEGLSVILNDVVVSKRVQLRLHLDDAGWRVAAGEQLERLGEGQHCLPRSSP